MKNTKFLILTLILTLILGISLTSCDNSKDGTDKEQTEDEGGETTDNKEPQEPEQQTGNLVLTENGTAKFSLVYNMASSSTAVHDAVRELQLMFSKAGMEVALVNSETAKDVRDCEILIGRNISHRDGYDIDTIPLGNYGYGIKVIGNKVIIKGGNDTSTIEALKFFKQNYLNGGTDLKNITIDRANVTEVRQEFSVPSITVDGEDLAKYKICFDENDTYAKATAQMLHDRIYEIAGYYLPFDKIDNNPTNAIVVRVTEDSGTGGYRVIEKDKNLYVECALPKVIEESTNNFMKKYLSIIAEGEIEFEKNFKYTESIYSISYCEFGGAKGDGITDDFEAIKKTHDKANMTGQTVIADPGRKYNLGQHTKSIQIKTDTIWTGVEFIIDDRPIKPEDAARGVNVFSVVCDSRPFKIVGIKKLEKGQKNVGMTFEMPCMLLIKNENKRQYIRYGINESQGDPMQEVILVDKNGDVDPMTPIMWDYDTVTSVTAYPIDDKPITISGGTFITYANCAPREYNYYARGIGISRNNVTMKGQKHLIKEEGENGAPYSGFIVLSRCNNILMEDMVVTGHKKYTREADSRNNMGTYEFGGSFSNNITWKNVTQTNEITDSRYWGVMGTNYCKNMTYDGCVLSRFDAHSGVYNASILNSKIGHQNLSIIGLGTLRVENTEFFGGGACNTVINLRSDYGSTWDGDVYIKNITVHNSSDVTLINGSWTNHNFGYTCHLPGNVYIDGVKLMDNTKRIRVLGNFASSGLPIDKPEVNGAENKNPYVLTENIYIESNKEKNKFVVSDNSIFKNTKLLYK